MLDDVLVWLGPLIAVTLITGGVILVIVILISWVDASIIEKTMDLVISFVDSLMGLSPNQV
ncbi:hypothetical protein FGU46_07835 [Methanobacterium sp. CWC-01]|uniref:hypothetical protein n=1 Tax=Methanobacterium aridiramus TaxID=2584467 RepID=UPI002574D4A3|nr:hypothetical protein [Methanobacterium sp. CWC-01]WJI10004.1 hypothetical protein FGU46_07835 [Methanobacterium sp. CWC-01]